MAKECEESPSQVFLLDDHAGVLQGLRRAINLEDNLRVCGTAQSLSEALEKIEEVSAQALVIDISFQELEKAGLSAIRQIRNLYQNLPILVFSMHEESLVAESAYRAGAQGYVMKEESTDKVIEGLETILEGGYYFSPEVRGQIFGE